MNYFLATAIAIALSQTMAIAAPSPHSAADSKGNIDRNRSPALVIYNGKLLLCMPISKRGNDTVPQKFLDCAPAPYGVGPSLLSPSITSTGPQWQGLVTFIGVVALVVKVSILLLCEVYDRCTPWEFGTSRV